ncbi:MAG TPA: beta-N-acetylhexosaminidase [Clostridium sp.]
MISLFNKKSIIWTIVALSLIPMVGCSSVAKPSQEEIQQPKKEIDPIEEQVKNMTLEEKIGQMVIIGLDGYTMDDNTRMMIEDDRVGGFILFGENVKSSDQLLALVNSLKNTNSKNKLPLFISVDQEGGRVNRMPGEFKNFPANQTIGKVNNGDFSYEIGSILGEEIKALGFNMDFAPVLDINSNPKNLVIGDRSFGTNAEVVSKLGIQTMKGIQTSGVIPVVKHFPGHGDTSVDSHIGLPSVDNDMNRLKSFELVPFNDAIKNGADAVMVAHILLNKIDSQNPASLSKTIITDILRTQLNFNGLVITDDMTMGAIVKNYTISNAAIKSVNAGSDIVLVCHGHDNEVAVIDALKKAVEEGTIPEERINESIYRILKLKYKYKLTDSTLNSIDVGKINSKINNALDTYLNHK